MEDNGVKCKDLKSLSIHFLQRNQSVYEIYLFEIKIFYVSMVVKGNLKQTKLNYSQYFECFKYCRKIPLWLNGQGVKRNKYALAINFQIYLWISLGPRCSIIPDYDDCRRLYLIVIIKLVELWDDNKLSVNCEKKGRKSKPVRKINGGKYIVLSCR
mgnify:CR=1 FL=1